jgi:hypothetical protein
MKHKVFRLDSRTNSQIISHLNRKSVTKKSELETVLPSMDTVFLYIKQSYFNTRLTRCNLFHTKLTFKKSVYMGGCTLVIPATTKAWVGGSNSKAHPGQIA